MLRRVFRTHRWFLIPGVLLLIGCGQQPEPHQSSAPADSSQAAGGSESVAEQAGKPMPDRLTLEGFVLHAPLVHENLAVFPVSLAVPNLADRFITLDEGLKNGTIEVFELSRSESTAGQDQAAETESASDARQEALSDQNDIPEVAADPAANQSPVQMNVQQSLQQSLQQSGNSVNQVYVRNRSDRPLYLMPGEIILGGDQDRTIGEEIVIAPSADPVKVEVFCVEHGRWGGRSAERTVQELTVAVSNSASASSIAANLAPAENDADAGSLNEAARQLSEQAANGQFIASVGVLTKRARLAAQGNKDQGVVWEEVAAANASAKSQIDTGAFTQNYVQEENIKRFEGFVDTLQDEVAGTENVVGVVVAVNGKIDAADVFESTPLFRKLWPKLLKSYALDAANRAGAAEMASDSDRMPQSDPDEPSVTVSSSGSDEISAQDASACTLQDAVAFLQKAKAAQETASDVRDGMTTSHRSDESVDSFSLRLSEPSSAPAAGGLGGGGLDGAVHFSGFSK